MMLSMLSYYVNYPVNYANFPIIINYPVSFNYPVNVNTVC